METLPLFLDKIVGEAAAIIISVSAVLIFGEIVPQAIFLKYALPIGSFLMPMIWGLIGLLFILGWPLSKLIDIILGEDHGTMYQRRELMDLIDMHAEGGGEFDDDGNKVDRDIARLTRMGLHRQYVGNTDDDDKKHKADEKKHKKHAPEKKALSADEARIIRSVLAMNTKVARDVMTPLAKIEALDANFEITDASLQELNKRNLQYFAVRSRRGGFQGVLLATVLIGFNPGSKPLAELLLPLTIMPDDMSLFIALNTLHRGNVGPMALVCDHDDMTRSLGILTLDDIITEMLKSENEDEVLVDVGSDVPDVPIPLRPMHHDNGKGGSSSDGYRNTATRRAAKAAIAGSPLLRGTGTHEDDDDAAV